jgi:hypothetical protein
MATRRGDLVGHICRDETNLSASSNKMFHVENLLTEANEPFV